MFKKLLLSWKPSTTTAASGREHMTADKKNILSKSKTSPASKKQRSKPKEMPALKKTKSNDALTTIPSRQSGTHSQDLQSPGASSIAFAGDFAGLPKQSSLLRYTRLSLRFAQIAFSIFAVILCTSQDAALLNRFNLFPAMIIMAAFSMIAPFVAFFLASIYHASYFVRRWTVDKSVVVESCADILFVIIYLALSGVAFGAAYGSGGCPVDIAAVSCNRLLWASWTVMLTASAFFGSLVMDLFVVYGIKTVSASSATNATKTLMTSVRPLRDDHHSIASERSSRIN